MSSQNVGKMMMANGAPSSPQLMGDFPCAQQELFNKSAMNISEKITASRNKHGVKEGGEEL